MCDYEDVWVYTCMHLDWGKAMSFVISFCYTLSSLGHCLCSIIYHFSLFLLKICLQWWLCIQWIHVSAIYVINDDDVDWNINRQHYFYCVDDNTPAGVITLIAWARTFRWTSIKYRSISNRHRSEALYYLGGRVVLVAHKKMAHLRYYVMKT